MLVGFILQICVTRRRDENIITAKPLAVARTPSKKQQTILKIKRLKIIRFFYTAKTLDAARPLSKNCKK